MSKIRLYGVKWGTYYAGPSPCNNERNELYFAGCKKAINGNPCKNCFNSNLWNSNNYLIELSPKEIVETIKKFATNKFITIVGGEPTDQMDGLIELCTLLKNENFHIIVFTHKNLIDELKKETDDSKAFDILINNIDILIDGQYEEEQNIYDYNKDDGFHNAVGSGNQMIWDANRFNCLDDPDYHKIIHGISANELETFCITYTGETRYIKKPAV